MGRSIVRKPKVFLFDEPLSNLDAKLRVQMRMEIRRLHKLLKTTTIYVTHDQIEAMTMADKIVVMNGGNIEQIGEPLSLYDLPQNMFVATFIGSPSMNTVQGTMEGDGFVSNDGIRWPLAPNPMLLGREVVLGVRPEHLVPGQTGVAGEVYPWKPLGLKRKFLFEAARLILFVFYKIVETSKSERP
jgi:multiple sugar transport system ATP-binding protein